MALCCVTGMSRVLATALGSIAAVSEASAQASLPQLLADVAVYKDFFPFLTAAVTVLAIIMTGRWSRTGARDAYEQQLQLTQGSFLRGCNEQYAKIIEAFWEAINRTPPPEQGEALALYRRYWGLQHDQYQYFKRNLVTEEDFRYWLIARHIDYRRPGHLAVAGIDFREGWQRVRAAADLPDTLFYEIVDRALDENNTAGGPPAAVNRALAHYRNANRP